MRPRRTVMEALGRTKTVSGLAITEEVRVNLPGSAWLLGPSSIQAYCSLPKVTMVTGPEKKDVCRIAGDFVGGWRLAGALLAVSSKATWMEWALDSSRLTSMSDQFPSGRWRA